MKASAYSLNYSNLLLAAREWVTALFKEHHQPYLHYHNLQHTKQVVSRSLAIAQHYDLNEFECAVLEIAAWFHDTGHLFGPTLGHEEVGVARVVEFLKAFPTIPFPPDLVSACILSTKMTRHPCSFLEAVIRDADTYHLGTPYFIITDSLLKREIEERTGATPADWEGKAMELLRTHYYHTFYCHSQLEAGKHSNYDKYAENARSMSMCKSITDPSSYLVAAGRAC